MVPVRSCLGLAEKSWAIRSTCCGHCDEKRVGDFVRTGDVLAEFHVNEQNMLQEAMRRFSAAFAYSKKPADPPKLVYGLVDEQGLHDE